jgi:hypothetical protein
VSIVVHNAVDGGTSGEVVRNERRDACNDAANTIAIAVPLQGVEGRIQMRVLCGDGSGHREVGRRGFDGFVLTASHLKPINTRNVIPQRLMHSRNVIPHF